MTHDERVNLKKELIECLNQLNECAKRVIPEIESDVKFLNEILHILKSAKVDMDHKISSFSVTDGSRFKITGGIPWDLFRSSDHNDHFKRSIEKVDEILNSWIEYSKTVENSKESHKTEIDEYIKKFTQ